jgi:hypothetical protein
MSCDSQIPIHDIDFSVERTKIIVVKRHYTNNELKILQRIYERPTSRFGVV